MANYSLVINSQFQPFSYQELTAPLDRQELYQEKINEEYDKLSSQADILEAMGQNDRDKNSGTYQRYKAYSDALRQEADELYRFGLNSESRQRLSNLRRRYNSEIVPIQNAWTKREKEADDQMKAQLQNPSLMFTRDARNSTLDHYINNPTGGYGVINGANITAQMAGMAKNLAKQVREGKKENIDAYTYNYIEKYGLDENIIRNWQDSPTLKSMFEQVMKANGVTPEALEGSANAQNILSQSTNYAEMGMWNAMGEDKSHIQENYGARLAAQEASANRRAAYAHSLTQQDLNGGNNNLVNPLPLRSQQQVSDSNKQIQEYIQKGYVKQDEKTGQWIMTPEGFKEYRRMSASGDKRMAMLAAGEASNSNAMAAAQKMPDTVPSKFRKFMDAQNGGKSFVDDSGKVLAGWGPGRAGNLFAQAIRNNQEGSYDTYHSTEYDRQIPSSYGGTFTEQMWSAARMNGDKKVFDVVDYDGKKGWKNVETKDASDLKGYKVTNVRYSKYGNTAILQKDGEEPIRVRIPRGMNLGAEQNVQAAIANADDFGKVLGRGKRPMLTKDGTGFVRDVKGEIMFTNVDLTPEDRAIFRKYQRDALNEMGSYGSQMVVPSETESEKYKPFGF